MNNIEQYRKRFYMLMESEMGNVKPLISEDDRGTSLNLEDFKGKITARLRSYSDESISFHDQVPTIPVEIEVNPNSLNLEIPGYSWDYNEKFTVVVEFPEEFKGKITLPSDTSRATLQLRNDGKQIFITSNIKDNSTFSIDNFIVKNLVGGPLSITIRFGDNTVINQDSSNEPRTRNYVDDWNIYLINNGDIDLKNIETVKTETVTYYPENNTLKTVLRINGEKLNFQCKCDEELPGESGKVVITLSNNIQVAIEDKKYQAIKRLFCPAPSISAK